MLLQLYIQAPPRRTRFQANGCPMLYLFPQSLQMLTSYSAPDPWPNKTLTADPRKHKEGRVGSCSRPPLQKTMAEGEGAPFAALVRDTGVDCLLVLRADCPNTLGRSSGRAKL